MRFYIIGSDGQRYGPVDLTQLQQWVNENRVTRTTMVVEEMSGVQYAAGAVNGLQFPPPAGAPQAGVPQGSQHYYRPGYGSAPSYSGPVPNTGASIGLAIFSMVCCCLIGGVISLIYAIQANSAVAQGNYADAARLDATARTWAYWSLALGFIGVILSLIVNVGLGM